jgi:hypothetical protein
VSLPVVPYFHAYASLLTASLSTGAMRQH